jgi:hypothetical protein
MSDPVDGMLQLTACSAASYEAAYSNCRMQGVVTAPGIAPAAVEHLRTAPTKKWPEPGQTIPVRVDRADTSRLEIRWDAMPTNRELGRQQAQQAAQMLAAQMPGGQMPGGQMPGTQMPGGQMPGTQMPWDQMPAGPYGQAPATTGFPPSMMPPQVQGVVGDPSRPRPGMAGGGLTPEQAAGAASGGAAAAGLQPATARVLAVHDVPVPPGLPGGAPAGNVDLTLDVALPSGGGYSTTMRIGFSTAEKRARIAAVGTTLPVLVNPAARDQIAIDTGRLG